MRCVSRLQKESQRRALTESQEPVPTAGREEAGKGVSVQGRVTGGMTGHTGSKKEVSLEWLKQQGSRG